MDEQYQSFEMQKQIDEQGAEIGLRETFQSCSIILNIAIFSPY